MKAINEFKGKYYFLSNFYSCPIEYNEINYLNSEAAFQAQKCPNRALEFSNLTPNRAKLLGRRVDLRNDWEDNKINIMESILRVKFSDDKLKNKLIDTYPAELIEGNTWNDKFWGVDINTGIGENNLGKILMKLRHEYINERT